MYKIKIRKLEVIIQLKKIIEEKGDRSLKCALEIVVLLEKMGLLKKKKIFRPTPSRYDDVYFEGLKWLDSLD